MKKSRIVLLCLLVILAVAIVALLSLHFKMRAFVYENTWRFCPDFNTYEKEFTLVKDYVEDYMCGNTGSLIVSNRKDHGYDLYDTETDSYINCPDEVKCAIREIAQKAFYHKDATLKINIFQFIWEILFRTCYATEDA